MFDSLAAFWPGMQVLVGDVNVARRVMMSGKGCGDVWWCGV